MPDIVRPKVELVVQELSGYLESQSEIFAEEQFDGLTHALVSSQFVCDKVKLYPAIVAFWLTKGIENLNFTLEDYLSALTQGGESIVDESSIMKMLRDVRQQHMMLIAWRDIAGAEVEQTLASLSDLADAMITFAADWAYQQSCEKWGVPRDELAREQRLMVIAMGKLGARELNFSSDIDLIFCYPSRGETDGVRSISNEEFFMRMCRTFVRLLDQQTGDGFVFRVDTRLRPFGSSGALALSIDAMDIYYQSHAREWERYAMIKARIVTGEEKDREELMSLLKAFVYRRYLDFGVFEAIRVMKGQIEEQLRRKDKLHSIKLGAGGIREIEFIGQAFQLIRGGRDKSLQQPAIVPLLDLLAKKGHIPAQAAADLVTDYIYLRRLENHIQELEDKQTHEMPVVPELQTRLVVAMRLESWSVLQDQTAIVMQRVHGYFGELVDFTFKNDSKGEIAWLDADLPVISSFLQTKGVANSERVDVLFYDFCQTYAVRQLQEKGADYLSQLLSLLVERLLLKGAGEDILVLFFQMLEKICNRVVYLVLLVENNAVLDQLIKLAKMSPWVITQVTRSPILLDELIDPVHLFNPPTKEELEFELAQTLKNIDAGDVEQQMEALRLFKQINVLRIAAADLTGVIPVMRVSDKLTDIAEVIVNQAVTLSWHSMVDVYGVPEGGTSQEVSGFSIVGFGKMGGCELGYGSDLDIVFLHRNILADEMTVGENPILLAQFYMRLARKVIVLLTTRTFSGPLYEIDLRLRPNGNSGLLVSSLAAFENYQLDKAWTWEHQAIVRARYIMGCQKVAQGFAVIRQKVLQRQRDIDDLRKDILDMREKMRLALLKEKKDCFDLKHGCGGIVDIEFIVQFGVLAKANQHKQLLSYTDNIRLLQSLSAVGFLTLDEEHGLSDAYKAYRAESHHVALAEKSNVVIKEKFQQHIQFVSLVWHKKFLFH